MLQILKLRTLLFPILVMVCLISIGNDVLAQKKKEKKRKKNEIQNVISEDDQRLAELYFTEAAWCVKICSTYQMLTKESFVAPLIHVKVLSDQSPISVYCHASR